MTTHRNRNILTPSGFSLRHLCRSTSGIALTVAVVLTMTYCTGGERTPQSMTQSEHPMTPQERWQQAQSQLSPGAFAPLVRLPFLFPLQQDDASALDSVNHAAHIILFWASWCNDCREETPALVTLQKEYPGLPWLTVSLDNEAEKARQYIWKNHIGGIHLFDGRDWRGEACTDYAVPLHGIPYMVLVDKEGKLYWTGQQTDSLRAVIEQLQETTCPQK